MTLNKNLLKDVEDTDLAKLILFAVDQDLRIDDYLTNQDDIEVGINEITWREDILGDAQNIVLQLVKNNSIEEYYDENRKCRYKLLRPLYVDTLVASDLITDELVENCRQYFKKTYCKISDRNAPLKRVKEHLIKWYENNPTVDVSILPKVFKYVVDIRVKENTSFVPNILNFINSNEEKSKETKDLLTYLEEYNDEDLDEVITQPGQDI